MIIPSSYSIDEARGVSLPDLICNTELWIVGISDLAPTFVVDDLRTRCN